jgi:hypothetical protein
MGVISLETLAIARLFGAREEIRTPDLRITSQSI